MVVDPVCKIELDAAAAAACFEFQGRRLYFCSTNCRDRFVANPAAYQVASGPGAAGPTVDSCRIHGERSLRLDPATLAAATGFGVLGSAGLLALYFGFLTLLSGWEFTVEQFTEFWPYIVALAIGFGIQVGLFAYLRRSIRRGDGKVVAVTGTTSGAAMASCCAHYLVTLLPALGATGLVAFVSQYQVQLFWVGLAANLAGVLYMSRRLAAFARGA